MTVKVFTLAILACAVLPTISIMILKPKYPVPHFRVRKVGLHKMRLLPPMKRQLVKLRPQPMFVPGPLRIRGKPFLMRRPPPFAGFKKMHFGKRKPLITKIGKFPMKFKAPLKLHPWMPKSTKFRMAAHDFRKPMYMPGKQWPMKLPGKTMRFEKPSKFHIQQKNGFPSKWMPGRKIDSFQRAPRPNIVNTIGQQSFRGKGHKKFLNLRPNHQNMFSRISGQRFFDNSFDDDFMDDFGDDAFFQRNDDDDGDDDNVFDDDGFDDISRRGNLNLVQPHNKDFEDDISISRRQGYYGSRRNRQSSPAIFGLDDDKLEKMQRFTGNSNPFPGVHGAFQQPSGVGNHGLFQQSPGISNHGTFQAPPIRDSLGAFQQTQSLNNHEPFQQTPSISNFGTFEQPTGVGNMGSSQQTSGFDSHGLFQQNPDMDNPAPFQQPWGLNDGHGGGSPSTGLDSHAGTHFDETHFPNHGIGMHTGPQNINAIDPFARQVEELKGTDVNTHVPDIHRTDHSNFRFETDHQGFQQGSLGFNPVQGNGNIKDGFSDVFKDFGGTNMASQPKEHAVHSDHGGLQSHGTHTIDSNSPIDGLQMLGHSHPNLLSTSSSFGGTNNGFQTTQDTNFHALPFNPHSGSNTGHIEDGFGSGSLALLGIDPRTLEPGFSGEPSGSQDHSISFGTDGHHQPLPSNVASKLPLHSSTTTSLTFNDDSLISAQSGTIFSQTPLPSSGPLSHQTDMLTHQSQNTDHQDTHVTFDTSAPASSASGPSVFGDIPQHDDTIFDGDFINVFTQQSQSNPVSHVPIGQDVFHNQQSPVTKQEDLSILAQFPSVNDIDFSQSHSGH